VDIFTSFNQTIEQIMNLNWDHDLQYAKFMTALSKSIGIGLARYCDLLEQKFSREMDRLTPEQEAAAQQTRQEKWLSMAKDFYSQKQTIEPFQFWPEVSSYPSPGPICAHRHAVIGETEQRRVCNDSS
jgi:hypothetical protein